MVTEQNGTSTAPEAAGDDGSNPGTLFYSVALEKFPDATKRQENRIITQ